MIVKHHCFTVSQTPLVYDPASHRCWFCAISDPVKKTNHQPISREFMGWKFFGLDLSDGLILLVDTYGVKFFR